MKLFNMVPAVVAGFCSLSTSAAVLSEDFSSDPSQRGWTTVGDTNLFRWDANRHALDATWDSSRPNSYYALPLGQALGRNHDFSFSFELELTGFVAGVDPQAPNPFQISIALINLSRASSTNFMRGTGVDSPDLIEFSFFPDPGGAWQWGPSLTASLVDSTGTNWFTGGFAPSALESNSVYRISVQYTAADQSLRAVVRQGNQDFALLSTAKPGMGFTDFAVDHFAISSYSGAGQFPAYAGSIWARGLVDNVTIMVPEALRIQGVVFDGNHADVRVHTRVDWSYSLERTTNLTTWEAVSGVTSGTGGELHLSDTNAPAEHAFYRVKAQVMQ